MSTATVQPSSLVAKLNLEWDSRYADVIRDFGLHEQFTGAQVLEQLRNTAPEQRDGLLYPLLTAAHSGNRHAERVLVQALIPVARRMAHRVTSLSDYDDWGERFSVAVVGAWEAIRRYQMHRKTRVWANLTMGLLGILSPRKSANQTQIAANTFAVDQDVLTTIGGSVPAEPRPETRLANLFTWAVDVGVLTREEIALLARVALGDETQAQVATDLGSTEAAVRMRVVRIRRRLSVAARSEF